MQIIPSAVYRVGDRPNMTSRDEQKQRACLPACDRALLSPSCMLHARMHASTATGAEQIPQNRAQAHSTPHSEKANIRLERRLQPRDLRSHP